MIIGCVYARTCSSSPTRSGTGAGVVDPHRCVDQNHCHSGHPAPRPGSGSRVGAAEPCQPPSTFLGDQCEKSQPDQLRLLGSAGEFSRFREQHVIEVECGAHRTPISVLGFQRQQAIVHFVADGGEHLQLGRSEMVDEHLADVGHVPRSRSLY